jgi:hypothetical protein
MRIPRVPLLAGLFATVLIPLCLASPAQAQDTGDSFKPLPMCSTPEPTNPSNYHLATLHKGHYGMSVELLQSKLGIQADGCFGPGTDKTVKRYQTCKGLVVDGIVGPQTWNSLERDPSMSNCKASATQSSNTLNSAGLPIHCDIGLTCVIVNRSSKSIKIFYSSSGELISEGPMIYNRDKLVKGTFKVTEKIRVNYSEFLDWKLNKFIRFSGHFGFHEIPISVATGERMHGEELLGTGTRQSGGCIRTGVDFQAILWSYTVVGTPVVVI